MKYMNAEPQNQTAQPGSAAPPAAQAVPKAYQKTPDSTVVMPDGTQRVPLGSGVITSFLGQGGMANVYEIWNGHLEVYRAVKLINPNCSRDARERFETEIKITAKLHHPNITEIYGVGTWQGLPFIEMEKLDGATLDVMVHERGAMPPWVCTAIGIMIGRALKYAHSQDYALYGSNYKGVVHRDLKPSNIMVCRNGSVKLMDFGIASPAEASFHTVAGTVLGTLQYLAPEQLECKKLDVTSDLYSLGTSMYEVLTGAMAFSERGVHKLMLDKLKGKFKPLEEYRLKVPRRLRRLIHRCMQQEPHARVQSAGELLEELGRIHQSLTNETPEQVMRRLLETPAGEKVVVGTRIMWPLRLAAGVAATAAIGVGVAYLVPALPDMRPAPERTVDTVTVMVESVAPPPETVTVAMAPPRVEPRPRTTPQPAAAVPTPVPPVAAAAPAPPPPKTPVDIAAAKYGLSDVLELIKRETRAGAHTSALALYDYLSAEQKKSSEARLYRLRALRGEGRSAQLRQALGEGEIADGEYFLMRAQSAYEQGRYREALGYLDKGSSLPRMMLDYEQFKRESSYCRARCTTAMFDRSPGEESYKQALDAWYELRVALREEPTHAYMKVMQNETQRIGQKRRELSGGEQ